jgi:hypothetical protein
VAGTQVGLLGCDDVGHDSAERGGVNRGE